jgi:hypothetical protein
MSRFEQELAIVPKAARFVAGLASLAMAALFGGVFVLPVLAMREGRGLQFLPLLPVFLAALLGIVSVGLWILLIGYVHADARRRGMNALLWTLLAIFIPSGVGIILFFILRDPIAIPCPSCGTPARKGFAFCASCGAPVRRACGSCHQPVEPGWRNCPSCGAAIVESPPRGPDRSASGSTSSTA